MIIGIPREIRRNEHRISLVPGDVAVLIKAGHKVFVEENACIVCGYPADEYIDVGATVCSDVSDCDLIVGVKNPRVERLKDGATVMAYLHVEKGQNARLLKVLRKKRILSYAFEELRDKQGERVVNLGHEAGLVGITEGLRVWGAIRETHGKRNPFKMLLPSSEYGSKEAILSAMSAIRPAAELKVVIMGKGCVSSGVQEVLKYANIVPEILCRAKTPKIRDYVGSLDILVNSVDWYPEEPHIVKKTDLELFKRTALIVDISCDTNGAIETCLPTTWHDPVYETEGVTHFCVNNLPSAIPKDSSAHLSAMILPHVVKVANGEELGTGMMTRDGAFVYQRPV